MAEAKKEAPKKKIAKRKVETTAADLGALSPSGARYIADLHLTLPEEKNDPATTMGSYTTLLYGKRKIGKTTLAANFTDSFALMFEPGGNAVKSYQVAVPDWEHFLGYLNLLEQGNHKFKTVNIDTGGIAYDRCLEYVCRVNGIQHPGGQNDYGASWKKVSVEFEKAHARLFALGLGIVVIAHERVKDIETQSGDTFQQVSPNLPAGARAFYAGMLDNILYYEYYQDKRFLRIRGTDYIEAGTRCQENFLTPSGARVIRIPMGDSPEEAYANLAKAFNNKQEETYSNK